MSEPLRFVLDVLAWCAFLAACAWLSHRPRLPTLALAALVATYPREAT